MTQSPFNSAQMSWLNKRFVGVNGPKIANAEPDFIGVRVNMIYADGKHVDLAFTKTETENRVFFSVSSGRFGGKAERAEVGGSQFR